MEELQLALIKSEGTMPKLKKIALTELPLLEALDLEKGQPDNAFVQDIINRGQLEPITVIKIAVNRYSIVAGNKRTAAFIKINELMPDQGYDKILAMVVNESEEAAVTGAVASNQMRHGNAITDLKGIKYLIEKYPSMGDKSIAASLGMFVGTLKRRKKLLKLNDVLFQATVDGLVSIPVAEYIADRPYLAAAAITRLAEKKVVSLDALKDIERGRQTDLLASNADQLGLNLAVPDFPHAQPNAGDIAVVEEFGLILLGVAYLMSGTFLTGVLDDQDEKAKELEGQPDIQKVYVFGK